MKKCAICGGEFTARARGALICAQCEKRNYKAARAYEHARAEKLRAERDELIELLRAANRCADCDNAGKCTLTRYKSAASGYCIEWARAPKVG